MPTLAEPPRTITREDRRVILDALDKHYLVAKQCYERSLSDKALAQTLRVPWAWVAEERERAFGPDVNEAASEHLQQLEALERRATALEEKALATATEAEAIKREAAKLRTSIQRAA